MKKLLNLLGIVALIGTPTINVVACIKEDSNNENFKEIFDINHPMMGISGLTTDNENNIYASISSNYRTGDQEGEIYKCLKNEHKFTKMKINGMVKKNNPISSIITDNEGNIYAGSTSGKVYKCLKNKNIFTEMTNITGNVLLLVVDNEGNIYASSTSGKVYKCLKNKNIFTEIKIPRQTIQGWIISLTVDNEGNIYAGNTIAINMGLIWKCQKNKDTFDKNPIFGASGEITALSTDENENVYAGTSTFYGKVYKCLKNTTIFKEEVKLPENWRINVLSIYKNSIYVGKINGYFYKIDKNNVNNIKLLMKIKGNKSITSLSIYDEKNIYIGTEDGKIYKSNF